MDTKLLEKIGMTAGEVRVYLALLKLGSSSTGDIINQSNITSSKVYLILERLEKKGLASFVIKNNVKYFQATDPNRLLDYMNERKKELEKEVTEIKGIIPELIEQRKKLLVNETRMFSGAKGIEASLHEFISGLKKGDEYVVLGATQPIDKNFALIIRQFYLKKTERGIKTRLIYNINNKKAKDIYAGIPLTKIKFINHVTPSSVVASKDKTLILTYSDEPFSVLITNSLIAASFYAFFESLWKISK